MKFYLSSFKFGDDLGKSLKVLMPANNKIGLINNARDYTTTDHERRIKNQTQEIEHLNRLGFQAELIDLKDYFHKEAELRDKLKTLGSIFVSGGNTFVLRAAMRLSGFDTILQELSSNPDFLYAGYSAGICILSKDMHYLHVVDQPYDYPFKEIQAPIWEGLGYFDYAFLPHYDSDHPETEDIGKSVDYCINHKILFKALRDGEVIIIE